MKERRALDILGQVNEKYVVEAAFTPKTKRKPVLRLGLAACLCLIIAGTFGGRSNNPIGFVLTAYAADGVGYEVSKTPTVIRNDMGTDFFSTTISKTALKPSLYFALKMMAIFGVPTTSISSSLFYTRTALF